ncbi:50S ribosomal protein L32 [Enterococcus olivae]
MTVPPRKTQRIKKFFLRDKTKLNAPAIQIDPETGKAKKSHHLSTDYNDQKKRES